MCGTLPRELHARMGIVGSVDERLRVISRRRFLKELDEDAD